MSKKILILNGSPRSKGNTAMLCDAFSAGARSAGHQVTRFDLHKLDIHGCLGCVKGGKDPASPCVQKDDMGLIYPVYREADLVVLASPMYYWGFSGQLKTAFDRLFAVAECFPGYANPHKECALVMAAEGDSADNWKPVLDYYHALLGFLGWKDRGQVLAGGVFEAGAVPGSLFWTRRFASAPRCRPVPGMSRFFRDAVPAAASRLFIRPCVPPRVCARQDAPPQASPAYGGRHPPPPCAARRFSAFWSRFARPF